MERQMSGKRAERISAEAAAALVKSGDWVDYGFGLGQPEAFDRALAARKDALQQVKIRGALSLRPRQVLEVDPGAPFGIAFTQGLRVTLGP